MSTGTRYPVSRRASRPDLRIPAHIGAIMDGNGPLAKRCVAQAADRGPLGRG